MPKDRETNSIWPNLEPSLMVNLIQEHKYICYKWGGERLSQIGAFGERGVPSEVTQAVTLTKSATKLGMLHLITTSLPTMTESSGTVTRYGC